VHAGFPYEYKIAWLFAVWLAFGGCGCGGVSLMQCWLATQLRSSAGDSRAVRLFVKQFFEYSI